MSISIAPLTTTGNPTQILAVALPHRTPVFSGAQLLPQPTASANEQRYAVVESVGAGPAEFDQGGTLRRGSYEKIEAKTSPIGPIKRYNFSEQLRVPVVILDANGNTVYTGENVYTIAGSNLLTGAPLDQAQRNIVWAHLQRLVNLHHLSSADGSVDDSNMSHLAYGVLEIKGAGNAYTGSALSIELGSGNVTNVA